MDRLDWALIVIVGILCFWCFYQDHIYQKMVKKKTQEAYHKGFQEGVKTSKTFDASSFIESKYVESSGKW